MNLKVRHRQLRNTLSAILVLCVAGCGGEETVVDPTPTPTPTPTPPPPPPPAVATTLEMVSGDGQNGKTTQPLANALIVRVLDDAGQPFSGATVTWSVTSGLGTVSGTSSTTSASGQANISFTPGDSLGTTTVEASVSGLAGSPQVFTIETTVWLVRIQNLEFRGWDLSSDHVVAVGDTIEWVNLDNESVTGPHTVTSSSEPVGGSSFGSSNMNQNVTFRFVPDAAGAWDYFCMIHGADVMSGTITAM